MAMKIDARAYDIRFTDSRWDRARFRLEHWLLSPNRTPTGQLRGYLLLKEWRDCSTTPEKLRAVMAAVKFPVRALRDAMQAVRQHGAWVEQTHGIPVRTQLVQLWWARVRHGALPPVYFGFQLFRPGQLGRASEIWQGMEGDRFYRMLSVRESREEAELLLDKVRLEKWLVENGIRTTRTLLELEGGEIVRSSLPDGHLPPSTLFSKPNDALHGRGARRWAFDGERWVGPVGRLSENELLDAWREISRTEGSILVQEQLRNHSRIAAVAPGALGTVRVLTLRGSDGVVRVLFAICKLPTGESLTDHMQNGGVAAQVDLATGRLTKAVGKSKTGFTEPREFHPDTGVRLEGFELPHWDEVMRTAIRAHESLSRMLCIGWDIAILEEGPAIIEGNDNPGHASTQVPTGIGLGATPVPGQLLARLEESFARSGRSSVADG